MKAFVSFDSPLRGFLGGGGKNYSRRGALDAPIRQICGIAALIFIVLLPATISDPQRIPTVSAATVTLSEIHRAAEVSGLSEFDDSRDTLVVQRPIDAIESARSSVFVVDRDGVLLRRVPVAYGRASQSFIQILSGVSLGDRIVVSDMRGWDAFDRLRLR